MGDEPPARPRRARRAAVRRESRIWWDPKLQGNDYFSDTLEQRLQRVKALIAIVSPRYVKSDWGRRELAAFCKAAEEQGGVRVRDKARIFKVLKTPVDRELHPPSCSRSSGMSSSRTTRSPGRCESSTRSSARMPNGISG